MRANSGGSVLLEAGRYSLALDPWNGGSITRFEWNGVPLFRTSLGPSILDQACFPLVPFSNRIALGRFTFDDHLVTLPPNFPNSDHPHTLHGFGWQSNWVIKRSDARSCLLTHVHPGGPWPWPYSAAQELVLSETGLRHTLRIANTGERAMPAGLGFHPYFPMTPAARYLGLHRTEWLTDESGLPYGRTTKETATDWWFNTPVNSRVVDTAYTGREGSIFLTWPELSTGLEIMPSCDLDTTIVYVPRGGHFFCVEPVTHTTDAFNRYDGEGLRILQPGETLEASVDYSAFSIPSDDQVADPDNR